MGSGFCQTPELVFFVGLEAWGLGGIQSPARECGEKGKPRTFSPRRSPARECGERRNRLAPCGLRRAPVLPHRRSWVVGLGACGGASAPVREKASILATGEPPTLYVFSVLAQGVVCPNRKASRRLASPVAGGRSAAETTGKRRPLPHPAPRQGCQKQGPFCPLASLRDAQGQGTMLPSGGLTTVRLRSCDACGVELRLLAG